MPSPIARRCGRKARSSNPRRQGSIKKRPPAWLKRVVGGVRFDLSGDGIYGVRKPLQASLVRFVVRVNSNDRAKGTICAGCVRNRLEIKELRVHGFLGALRAGEQF